MGSFTFSRALVLATALIAGTTSMAQTPAPSQSPSASPSGSAAAPSPSPDSMSMPRPPGPGQYAPGQHHAQRYEHGMMGGGMGGAMAGAMGGRMPQDREAGGPMMGGQMMGRHMMGGHMMDGCPIANALPPGNEKLAMRMHGEIMVAIGNILIKNADNIQSKPSN